MLSRRQIVFGAAAAVAVPTFVACGSCGRACSGRGACLQCNRVTILTTKCNPRHARINRTTRHFRGLGLFATTNKTNAFFCALAHRRSLRDDAHYRGDSHDHTFA